MKRRSAIVISIFGFLASLAVSFVVLPRISADQHVNFDADEDGEIAQSLYLGNGLSHSIGGPPALDRGPVYPFVVAGMFALAGGYSLLAVQWLQALLHAASAYLFFLIALRFYRYRTAVLAELVFILHPIVLWYTGRLWLETTLVFILLSLVLVMLLLFEVPTVRRAVMTGVLLGITCLAKSVLLLFPAVLLAVLARRHGRPGLKAGLIAGIVCFLVISPWTLRNYLVSGAFVPVHTTLGFNLIQGDVIGEHWPGQWCCTLDLWKEGEARADSILAAHGVPLFRSPEGDGKLIFSAFRGYARNPVFLARKVAANFLMFWSLSESVLKSWVYAAMQCFLLIASLWAYLANPKERTPMLPVVALAIYYVAVHSLIVGWGRYSMPMVPLLILISARLVDKRLPTRKL